jgi:hypothetical protein
MKDRKKIFFVLSHFAAHEVIGQKIVGKEAWYCLRLKKTFFSFAILLIGAKKNFTESDYILVERKLNICALKR